MSDFRHSEAHGLQSFTLGEIAHIEMGQSPDSKCVVDDPFIGSPFLQGNAEFGVVSPEPRFGCLRPAKMCKVGDVLISVRAPVGAVNIADLDYCIGRGLAAIRLNGIKPSLAGEVIARRSSALRRVAQGTTFEAISKSDLLSLKLTLPSMNAWPKIAQILDTIDTAIIETETIIAKLKAIKQGLLHDLLTRGIDANGELRAPQSEAPHLYKPSPLGWIPKEWSFGPLQTWLDGRPKNGYSPQEAGTWTGIQMLGLGCLTFNGFQPVQLKSAPRGDKRLRSVLLADGDLLVSRSNTRDLVGLVGIYRDVGTLCTYPDLMMRLRPSSETGAEFLQFVLQSPELRRQIQAQAVGTSGSMVKISGKVVSNLVVAIPGKIEQDLVLERLAAADSRLTAEERQIKLLREVKIGLMDDLLIGRIHVTPLLENSSP